MHEDGRPVGDDEIKELPELNSTTSIEGEFCESGDNLTCPGQRVSRIDDENQFQAKEC